MQQTALEYSKQTTESVLEQVNSRISGLSDVEVEKKLLQYGRNALVQKNADSVFKRLFIQFINPLVLVLIFAAGVSFMVGEKTDAAIIILIVLVSVFLGFYQEHSAGQALKKLTESVKTTVTVRRNGKNCEIDATDVVIGDILVLQSGAMIVADARIIETKYLFVNQSSVTGESFAVEKASQVCKGTDLINAQNMIFAGTNVVSGNALAVVVATGKHTEFGKISATLAAPATKSEFEIGVTHFGLFLTKIIFILVIGIFFINSFLRQDFIQSFLFAIAIAVGVTPELLPMIMTITMTFGSRKMSKQGVIVRKLSAIPNFGGMDILCTDKTGTLTKNLIEVVKYVDFEGKQNEQVLTYAQLNSAFQTGIKNPIDDALIAYKSQNLTTIQNTIKKIDEIPYDFLRKRISVVVEKSDTNSTSGKKKLCELISKGAPEEILKICSFCRKDTRVVSISRAIEKSIQSKYTYYSRQGYRVIAVCSKPTSRKINYTPVDERAMIFEGFIALFDPPKDDVKDVLTSLADIGVQVKVITGDNEFVTKNICDKVGLPVGGILIGSQIEYMNDEALAVNAKSTTIFARCSPDQKKRIIQCLKNAGHVVGFMGDGVNDTASLRIADVAISVDSAVDVAKEAADIVLTRKSLTVLKDGIIEGRKTFANTLKYIMMALSSNFGNMFSAAGAIIFLPFFPMLPVQILLNNLLYDFSQITIPTDNVDPEWIKKPKRWNVKFVKRFMYTFGPISSLFDFITFFVLYGLLHISGAEFQTGWFMVSLATQILVIHIVRTRDIPFIQSRPHILLLLSSLVFLAVGWILPYTALGYAFKFVPLAPSLLIVLVIIVIAYLFVAHIAKRTFYKYNDF